MNISIVIPNYNGEELLKKNLPKVFEAIESLSTDIIVVDDASTDQSVEFLKTQKIKLFRNEKNLGFSSTVNKGVEKAKGKIVVLLNSDAYPDKNFLIPLVEKFKDREVFAVGCLDKSLENGKIVLRGRGVGRWEKGFLMHSRGEINKSNTLWANGGGSAFSKEIWKKLGGLNTLYNPFYWEDLDISYRALKSGYKVLFERNSIINNNKSEGAIRKNYSNFAIKRIAYRNQFIFVWENATDLFLQFSHCFYIPYYLLRALIRRDWVFLLGFIDAFVLLPKIIKSSFISQKQFVKTDKEVIKEFRE